MPGAVRHGRYTGVDDDCHIHQSSNQSAPRTTWVLALISQKLHQGELLSHFPDQETGSGRRKDHTVLGHTVRNPQSQTQTQICLDPKLYPLSYPCYSSISFSPLSLPVILFVIYLPPRQSTCFFLSLENLFSQATQRQPGELLFTRQNPAWACPPGCLPDSSSLNKVSRLWAVRICRRGTVLFQAFVSTVLRQGFVGRWEVLYKCSRQNQP